MIIDFLKVRNSIDTRNFDDFEDELPWTGAPRLRKRKRKRKEIQFIGYTFKKDEESKTRK